MLPASRLNLFRHVRLLLSIFLAVSLVPACVSMSIEKKDYLRGEARVEVPSVKKQIKVRRTWAKNAGSISDQEFSKLLPAVSELAIFTASENGQVTSWKHKHFPWLLFKQKNWQVDLNEEVSAGLFEGYGRILLASTQGKVISLNSDTGEIVWEQELVGEVLVPPQGNGRFVIVQMAHGAIEALDFRTGEKKWSYKTPVPALTLRGTSTPVIDQEIVYVGFANGKVAALDIVSGTALWEMNVYLPEGGTELEQVVDVDGNLLVDTQRLYAASYQGKVVAFYKKNGRPLWKNDASNYLIALKKRAWSRRMRRKVVSYFGRRNC
jgi:outer membrane protein assembly factor BamB